MGHFAYVAKHSNGKSDLRIRDASYLFGQL